MSTNIKDYISIQREYYAFISYSHKNKDWAKWLQHELEYYKLPTYILEQHKDLPVSFRPVFRDEDELSGGDLTSQIYKALASSDFLIVICSPDAAESEYVEKEINAFIKIGVLRGVDHAQRIFPFIVSGKANVKNEEERYLECFPKPLIELKDLNGNYVDILAGNVNATNRDHAFVKVLAGTLREKNVQFSELWDRHALYKIEEEERKRAERNRLSIVESRYLSGKSMEAIAKGDSYIARMLALRALPMTENDDRPLCVEAEFALRIADVKESAVLRGHQDIVISIDIGANGNVMVSSSYDCTIRFWSVKNGCQIGVIHLDDNINANTVKFNKYSTKIVGALSDRTVRLWTVKINPFDEIEIIEEEVLRGHSDEVNFASFNNSGNLIVSCSNDGTIRIWDVKQCKEIGNPIVGHKDKIFQALFSKDDDFIVSCGFDKTIRIWDVESRIQKGHSLIGYKGWVRCLSLNKDNILASASYNERFIRIWDIINHREIKRSVEFASGINGIKFSHDGSKIAVALSDGKSCIWDMKINVICKIFDTWTDNVNSVIFGYDDEVVISCGGNGEIRKWNIHDKITFKNSILCKQNYMVRNISFDNQGRMLLSTDYLGKINIWNLHNNEMLGSFENIRVSSLALLTPDGTKVVSSCHRILKIWNIQNGREIATSTECHDKEINSIRISLSGTKIITASMDKTVIIWSFSHGLIEKKLQLFGHTSAVRDAVFSPDEKLIATAGSDSTIRIWDSNTGIQIYPPIISNNNVIFECILFSPDGKNIAVGTNKNSIHLFNVETREEFASSVKDHTDWINSISYSPDGKYIISASRDKSVRIWDAKNCKPIFLPLQDHDDFVNCVQFNPSSSNYQFASCGSDGSIRLWTFKTIEELIESNKERMDKRLFSVDEKKDYYIE